MNPRSSNRIASALALISLVLTTAASHAAPTVWNVNLGDAAVSGARQITTGDNYIGAAVENSPNSTWNAISVVNNSVTTTGVLPLVTSTGTSSTVTMNISAGSNTLNSGSNTLTTGDEIFYTWFKVNGNSGPMTVTFADLPALGAGESYALIIYSDWFFPTGGNMPIAQTLGTGLTGTFNFNRSNDPGNGLVGPLLEDTDPANVAATASTQFNFVRLNGLTPSGGNELAFSMTPGNSAVNGFQLIKTDASDTTPPDPNPMTWATPPAATSESSVTMTATTASDPSVVEYLFTETSGHPGGTSSGWQDSPVYTDTGLQPATTYTYTVTARDKSPAQNQTTPSTGASATTDPADTTPPATPGFEIEPLAITSTRITMTATTVSDPNGVEYYFTETSGNLGGSDSGWQDSPVYTDAGLTPSVTYTYKVKARDKSVALNETPDSLPASATTGAEGTGSLVWNVNVGNEITTSDNFAGAAAENTVPDSFWNSVTTANPTGLVLADSAESDSAGVTLTMSGPLTYGNFAPVTGPEIFSTWIKSSDNATPYHMTIGGLSFSKTYDLVIYSDWFWKGNGTLPLTQTLGSGLTGTAVLDQISSGSNGVVPDLLEDTDPGANTNIEGNWFRITGLTPDENGNLGFSMGGTNAAFSGFQLVQTSSLLARINSFGIPGAAGVINHAAKTISLTVPFGTDLATLAPEFTLAPGSTCNQTSGAPPSPNFAVSSTVNYVVTDTSTDPDTVNSYAVTVAVGPEIGILVIDLGNSPGTTIAAGGVIGSGPTNLPMPSLPLGSILRSITVNVTLQETDNDNWANDLSLLFGPNQGAYTLGFVPSGANANFSPAETLNWGTGLGEGGIGTSFFTTRTDADWLANIDLGAVGLFLGNAFTSGEPGAGGSWSGTITLSYDIAPSASAYANWATGSEPFNGDANGDGVTDGMAFLLGAATPAENAIGRLPTAESNGGLKLRFSSRDAASRGTSALKVQWSHDLGANDLWSSQEATVPPAPGGTVNGVVFVITENLLDPSIDDVQATIPSGQASGGKLFARLLGIDN